ncbi:MAG: HAD domain-containing protein [Christensenellales bacterium]
METQNLETEKQKGKFYVFLDVDGVLWDWKWRLSEIKSGKIDRIKQGGLPSHFKPESVEALNKLLNYLDGFYDVQLVLSSAWRALNIDYVKKVFVKNGISSKYVENIDKTPFADMGGRGFSKTELRPRGQEIMKYLEGQPQSEPSLIVLDNNCFDFDKYPKLFFNFIKTDGNKDSLNPKQIDAWIKRNIYERIKGINKKSTTANPVHDDYSDDEFYA